VTVRWRLFLTLGGVILLMALPPIYATTQLQRLRILVDELEAVHTTDALALGHLRAALAELDRLQRSYVAAPDLGFRRGMHDQVILARTNVAILAESYGREAERTRTLVDSLAQASGRLDDLMEAGLHQQATEYFEGVKPLLDSARASITPVAQALDRRGQQARGEAQAVSTAATRTTTLVVVIALLLTAALGLWTTDALSRPLSRLSAATRAVADGQFVAPPNLPYERDDEIGELSRSFGAMTERLAELDRLKAEFVSLASHELKTPINVIGGYTELLREGLYGELDERQAEILALVQEQTTVLTRLVNQLLDLSRFEAGGLPMEPKPTDVGLLLGEVERSFRALATQKQVEFEVVRGESLPSDVVIDPDRIRHEVLGNLLSNAFKFTSTGGTVRVRAWGENGTVNVEVSDTGVGIPQDQLNHIFEKYYQVGTEAKAKGSGLGLTIARHVVEAHGGRISVSSRPGEGTRFMIVLPSHTVPA
jgi:signal transduction histidine kinase